MAMTNEKAWNFAIGIVQMDGTKPSDNFLNWSKKKSMAKLQEII